MIKGLEVKEGKRREEVVSVMERIGVKVEIEEVRKIEDGKEEDGEMVIVKLA